MKAVAVFPEKREIQIVQHEAPKIHAPTQVKLRIIEVGICGTDREISSFKYGTPPAQSNYLIIGHESLCQVIEVGDSVTQVKPGDLAVPTVRRPCHHMHCIACRLDRQDFCYTGDFTERGIKAAHGFMAEFVVDDEKYINRIPKELKEAAVLVEPLTIVEKALKQVWQVQERLPWACSPASTKEHAYCHRAVVLGAGPVGLLGAMALLSHGFETFVYSRGLLDSPQARFAQSIGATYICSQTDSSEQLAKRVRQIDLVFEATGAAQISFEVMKFLGTNGVFIFTGVPGRKAPIELDADSIMRNLVLKNQAVFGSVNASRDSFEAAIQDLEIFIKKWPDEIRSFITGRYPIEAYKDLLLDKVSGIKNVISFQGNHL